MPPVTVPSNTGVYLLSSSSESCMKVLTNPSFSARVFQQLEYIRQLSYAYLYALPAGERKVLAVYAFERTARKKYCAAATSAAYGRLLPDMPARSAYHHRLRHAANPRGLASVRAALPRTKTAVHPMVLSSRSASIISYATCPSKSAMASARFSLLRSGKAWLYCLILQ